MNRLLLQLLRKNMSIKSVLMLMLLLSFAESQNIPASYTYTTTDIISVNGSSATGNCSNVTTNSDTSTCAAPSSSVLFDGHIPTLTGLDGDMWASQLLTLQPTTGRPRAAEITFDFSNHPNFRLQRLEVVMFNCPQKGIAVQNIRLSDATAEIATINHIISCDSLVRLCTPVMSTDPRLSLAFFPKPGSKRVYLAELRFFGNGNTCPKNIVITTLQQTSTAIEKTTNPLSTSETSKNMKTQTGSEEDTTQYITNTNIASDGPSISFTIMLVVVLLFLLVGIVVAVLILWRCYCAKHYKHTITQDKALEETQHTNNRYAQTHTHPALTLCEETGQVYYTSSHHAPGEDSPSHQTYSHLQQQTCKVREGAQTHASGRNEEEMGEYSTLSHGHNRPHELGLGDSGTESSPFAQQYYTRVDKKEKIEADKTDSLPSVKEKKLSVEIHTPVDQFYSAQVDMKKKEKKKKHVLTTQTYSSESDTRVDLLYAQVDKKKMRMQKDEETTQLHISETDTPVDQLYAQADKKKKNEETTQLHTSETDTPVDQMYTQVDKKKKKRQKDEETTQLHTSGTDTPLYTQVDKKKEKVYEVSCKESGAVYSVVNKPSAPQLPPKSQQLMEELQ